MEKRLIIKYNEKYICNNENNEINFIKIPNYNNSVSDFHNIDIFISLLCSKYLDYHYESTKGLTYIEGLEVFEMFDPDCIIEINFNTFLYDLDKNLSNLSEENRDRYQNNLKKLPGNLVAYSYEELNTIEKENNKKDFEEIISSEDMPFFYRSTKTRLNDNLKKAVDDLNIPRSEKDVLLLYSAGKDSTLAAIRLRNAGYNVHFIHFDNGSMLDIDKPYLTFKETFSAYPGYYFEFENHSIKIKEIFEEYFSRWNSENVSDLTDSSLDSEIRCLSCRMAMYTEAIKYAKDHNFKYIAEGARISQKFMIEQPPMIELLKKLTSIYGIKILYPVLDLEDDFEEKEELIKNGFSSKSWESKCLLGRKAKEKTKEDEKIIISYYEDNIKPKVMKKISDFKCINE